MNDNGSLFNDDDLFGSAEPVVRETRQPELESAPYAARYSNSRIKPISLDGLNPMQREAAEHVDAGQQDGDERECRDHGVTVSDL